MNSISLNSLLLFLNVQLECNLYIEFLSSNLRKWDFDLRVNKFGELNYEDFLRHWVF